MTWSGKFEQDSMRPVGKDCFTGNFRLSSELDGKCMGFGKSIPSIQLICRLFIKRMS